jgi:malonate decarboxylase holo-[acyl-carrier-protein] synthase
MHERAARHSMVHAAPMAWAELLAARPDMAREPLLAGWADAGFPLVVRRPACGDEAGAIPLGLPLPPAHGKRRIGLSLPPRAILRSGPPPLLREAAASAPSGWRAVVADLVRLDPQVRVFGSLAWQHLTGLPYVIAGSDIDLLWSLPPAACIGRLLTGIGAIERRAPMRIDGEILGPPGGVNWREMWSGGDVLVKSNRGVRLMAQTEFFAKEQA